MGADMTIEGIPAFRFTPVRREILRKTIESLSEDDLSEQGIDRQSLLNALDFVEEFIGEDEELHSREICHLKFHGMPYGYWITGGLSWGDSPTEMYEKFCQLSQCVPVDTKFHEWAEHDQHKPESDLDIAIKIIQEFVNDVDAAYPDHAANDPRDQHSSLENAWPDLVPTADSARVFLAKVKGGVD